MFSVAKSRIGKAMFTVLSGLLPFCVFGADPLDLPRVEFGKYYERITGTKPAEGLVEFVIDGKISQKGMDAYTIRSKGNGVTDKAQKNDRSPLSAEETRRIRDKVLAMPLAQMKMPGMRTATAFYEVVSGLDAEAACFLSQSVKSQSSQGGLK